MPSEWLRETAVSSDFNSVIKCHNKSVRCFGCIEGGAVNHLGRQTLQLLDSLQCHLCFHIKRKQCCICLQELVSEGPVPGVSKNSVTFVAEQVSHHPPSKFQSATSTFKLSCLKWVMKSSIGVVTVLAVLWLLYLPNPRGLVPHA